MKPKHLPLQEASRATTASKLRCGMAWSCKTIVVLAAPYEKEAQVAQSLKQHPKMDLGFPMCLVIALTLPNSSKHGESLVDRACVCNHEKTQT
eukprot:1060399-Amphidinium_carterae.1